MKKRGQIKISFGMIFSIILIIVFLAFGFYAIKTFFGISSSATTEKFLSDLKVDVDRVWKSTQSLGDKNEYFLPSSIEAVCFVDFSPEMEATSGKEEIFDELHREYTGQENLFFYPRSATSPQSAEIENIDTFRITIDENPYCIPVQNGKITLNLMKEYGEALVKITR